MNEILYVILKVLTSVSSLCIYVSPIPSMRRILKAQSSGEMQLIPLVSLFVNCHLRVLYGLFINDVFPMVSTFLVGEIMAVVYVLIFTSVTSDRGYVLKICVYGSIPTVLVSLYAVLAWIGATHQSTHNTSVVLGYVCVLSSIALYTSPLMTMKKVVRTRNAESIPIALVTVGFISNALWMFYGMAADEVFVWAPNLACVIIGLVQILLYVKYDPKKRLLGAGQEHELSSVCEGAMKSGKESPNYAALRSPVLITFAQ